MQVPPVKASLDDLRWFVERATQSDDRWDCMGDDAVLEGTDIPVGWHWHNEYPDVDLFADFSPEPLAVRISVDIGPYLCDPKRVHEALVQHSTPLVQVRAHADTVDDRGPTVVSQQLFSIELACEVTLGTVAHALPLDLLTDALLRQAVMVELDLWQHAAGDDVWPTDWATPLPTGQEHPTPDGSVALLPDQTWPTNLPWVAMDSLQRTWVPRTKCIPGIPSSIAHEVTEIEPWTWGGTGWAARTRGPGTRGTALSHQPEIDRVLNGDLDDRVLLSVASDGGGRVLASTTLVSGGLAVVHQTGQPYSGWEPHLARLALPSRARLQQFDCSLLQRLVKASPQPAGLLFVTSSDLHGDQPPRRIDGHGRVASEVVVPNDYYGNGFGVEAALRILSQRLRDHLARR